MAAAEMKPQEMQRLIVKALTEAGRTDQGIAEMKRYLKRNPHDIQRLYDYWCTPGVILH